MKRVLVNVSAGRARDVSVKADRMVAGPERKIRSHKKHKIFVLLYLMLRHLSQL